MYIKISHILYNTNYKLVYTFNENTFKNDNFVIEL